MGERLSRDLEKSEIVAGLVANLNLPCNAFNDPYLKRLFDLAKLGPVNDTIARRMTDDAAA